MKSSWPGRDDRKHALAGDKGRGAGRPGRRLQRVHPLPKRRAQGTEGRQPMVRRSATASPRINRAAAARAISCRRPSERRASLRSRRKPGSTRPSFNISWRSFTFPCRSIGSAPRRRMTWSSTSCRSRRKHRSLCLHGRISIRVPSSTASQISLCAYERRDFIRRP